MNRFFSISAGLCVALLAVACAKDSDHEDPSDNIGLRATTTRAAATHITDMHTGFRVYATSADAAGSWYPGIDGTNNHVYSGGKWGFQTPIEWPVGAGKYPMTFYAWYPVSPVGVNVTATPSATPSIVADIEVQPTAAQQVDVVASVASVAARPVSGNLSMTFNHIFSKVDFGVVPGRGVAPEIMAVGIQNLVDTRGYDFTTGLWEAQGAAAGTTLYDYYGLAFTDIRDTGAIDPANVTPWSPGVGNDETTHIPFYNTSTTPTADDAHLMLMPQTSPVWQQGNGFTTSDGAFVSILYRMTGADGDEVGFAAASSHPDFATLGDGYAGPLYVMAAFPLPADASGNFTWVPGKSYRYNIGLGTAGSSNGFVMDDHYYKSDGSRSTLPLIDNRHVGEQLNDGVIHIDLLTGAWGDEDPNGDLTIDLTANFTNPQPPYILYWDSVTGTMQLGAWNNGPGGSVTQANQLLFKAGSVIGFLNAGDAWDTSGSQIMFNPTASLTNAQLASSWSTIPEWATSTESSSTHPSGWDTDGFISTPSYHYEANVRAGYGDPCKMAGLTAEQIAAGALDNGKWVMSTRVDADAGYTVYGSVPLAQTTNTPYGMMVNSAIDTFLPAMGTRAINNGTPTDTGRAGRYWAAYTYAYATLFSVGIENNGYVSVGTTGAGYGYGVRCIGVASYPVVAATDALGTAEVSYRATASYPATTARQGQALTFRAIPNSVTASDFDKWTVTTAPAGFTLSAAEARANPLTISMPGGGLTLTASYKAAIPGIRNVGNSPGVIGYVYNPGKSDHNTLTWAKDDGDDTNGIIYVAYFKLGSAVALSSQNTGAFTAADIVKWPTQWAPDRTALEVKFAGAAAGTPAWDVVPDLKQGPTSPDLTQGMGDPCSHYFGPTWKTPTKLENWAFFGGISTQGTSAIGFVSNGTYDVTPASGVNPAIGSFPEAPGGPYSLPFTGYRLSTAAMAQNGYYWMADATASDTSFMMFNATTAGYSNTGASMAIPVRCALISAVSVTASSGGTAKVTSDAAGNKPITKAVQSTKVTFTATPDFGYKLASWAITTAPAGFTLTAEQAATTPLTIPMPGGPLAMTATFEPIPGIRNTGTADGVIGYVFDPGGPNHMKLTMEKDDGDDSDGIIYMAYFEFGSLVATSSQDNGDFTANDIIAWPNEWKSTTDDRAELNAFITGSGDDAWALVPVVNAGDGLSNNKNILTAARVKAENGLGDPCQYYAADLGPGWRMPTAAENVTFVGQDGTLASGSAYYNWSLTGTASATNVGVGTFPQSPEGPTTSLLAAGYRDASGLKWQGQAGLYLTSTASSGTAGYTLHVKSGNVIVKNPTSFPYGWPVRCIPTTTP